jgi:signal transduction histidine kinase
MRANCIRAVLASGLLALFALNAAAEDWITQRGWLEDPGGQQTWAQVQEATFQPFEGVLSKGFGDSVIWVKLKIDAPKHAQQAENLVVRLRPVYLDSIDVFDSAVPGRIAGQTGDVHHPALQPLRGLDFMVPLAAGPLPRDIWLRVTSSSTRQIHAEVLPEKMLIQEMQHQQLQFALYVGMVTIFALWGLSYWAFTKDKMVGLFGVKQTAALVYALCSLGYFRMWWSLDWPAAWLDNLSSLFSMLATSAAIYFHYVFLQDYQPRRWAVWVLKGLLCLLPINLLIFAMGHPMVALKINLMSVLVAPFVMLGAAWTAKGWRVDPIVQGVPVVKLSRFLVVGFYAVLVVILVLAALPGLGLSRGGEIGLYLVQAHGLASGLMVLLLLQYRAHLMRKAQFEAQSLLARTQLQVEQDRVQRDEQEKLLTMLTHELKTPLATIFMRLDERGKNAQAIKKSIREMNDVIDRCVQANKVQDHKLQVNKESLDLMQILGDVVASAPAPERIDVTFNQPIWVQTDRQLLFIVLNNLVENACKYSPKETPIRIAHQDMGDSVQLSICNLPGRAGWPQEARVFEKYYRSPGAQGQAGTGLGLFLVRSLALLLGCHIAYQPTSQHVCFVLTLPKS